MDGKTLKYIRSSMFTNSIKEFPGEKKENRLVVPESVLCLLAYTGRVISTVINGRDTEGVQRDLVQSQRPHSVSQLSSGAASPRGYICPSSLNATSLRASAAE